MKYKLQNITNTKKDNTQRNKRMREIGVKINGITRRAIVYEFLVINNPTNEKLYYSFFILFLFFKNLSELGFKNFTLN